MAKRKPDSANAGSPVSTADRAPVAARHFLSAASIPPSPELNSGGHTMLAIHLGLPASLSIRRPFSAGLI